MTGTGQKPFWGTDSIVTPYNGPITDEHRKYLSAVPTEAKMVVEIERLQKLLDDAVKVIDFYADESSWDVTKHKLVMEFNKISEIDMSNIEDLEMYGGERARTFLEKVKNAST